jgi:hypothetical protein
MGETNNTDQVNPCTTIEGILIASTGIDAAIHEIVRKIVSVDQLQNTIAAEYVLSQDGKLVACPVDSVKEAGLLLVHALDNGAEVLEALTIDATGNPFIVTFGVMGPPNERAAQDVLAFKDAFLLRHAALLRDPAEKVLPCAADDSSNTKEK